MISATRSETSSPGAAGCVSLPVPRPAAAGCSASTPPACATPTGALSRCCAWRCRGSSRITRTRRAAGTAAAVAIADTVAVSAIRLRLQPIAWIGQPWRVAVVAARRRCCGSLWLGFGLVRLRRLRLSACGTQSPVAVDADLAADARHARRHPLRSRARAARHVRPAPAARAAPRRAAQPASRHSARRHRSRTDACEAARLGVADRRGDRGVSFLVSSRRSGGWRREFSSRAKKSSTNWRSC